MKIISNKGFTLPELLVVVAILSVLLGIAIPSYKKISEQSKYNYAKPTLIHIYNLFRQNYIQKGHYGNLRLQDVSLPSGYCGILLFTAKGCKKAIPNHIKGDCKTHPAIGGLSVDSGFMVIAYGESQNINVGINHEKKIFEGKNWESFLSKDSCSSYTQRESCRKSGCLWNGTTCKTHPECSP